MKMHRLALALLLTTLELACSTPTTTRAAGTLDVAKAEDVSLLGDTPAPGDLGTDVAADTVAEGISPDVPVVGTDAATIPVEVTLVVDTTATTDPLAGDAIKGQKSTLSGDIDLVYPPTGAMAPADFAPITVQWKYSGGTPDVFVVRFENEEAQIDVIGDATKWKNGPGYTLTLPASIWKKLFEFPDHPKWQLRVLSATVQGGKLMGQLLASKPSILHVSAQKAGGALYYWNTQMQAVRVIEAGKTVASTVPTGGGFCTGCHSVSPDGSTVAVSHMMGAGMTSMSMQLVSAKSGSKPAWLHAKAEALLASSFTIAAAFSPKYFTPTDKWLVVPTSGSASMIPGATKLMAVDLIKGNATALVKGGDLGKQAFPTWSPDGNFVVYASAADVGNGFSATQPTSLYSVPFNGGQGGTATVLTGADDAGAFQYYPAFSVDGQWVAYNRVDPAAQACPSSGSSGGPSSGGEGTYDNCNAELWMIAAAGGKAIRLDNANQSTDPLTNSWPTFGNVVGSQYWMAFSSRRDYGFLHTGPTPSPQIYVVAIDPQKLLAGEDGSYAALWLPGQDMQAGCHIARWSSTPRD